MQARSKSHVLPALFLMLGASIADSATAAIRTVCPSGCSATTVQSAVSLASPGDVIEITELGEHTESGILVDKNLTIRGQSPTATFLQAAGSPNVATDRVIHVAGGVTVSIQYMTIRYGAGVSFGGCIYNEGTLELTGVLVDQCQATSTGGAIYSSGSLELVGTIISGSQAEGGGGVCNTGTMTGAFCELAGNTGGNNGGGGVLNSGSLSLMDCDLESNTAKFFGGGGLATTGGAVSLVRTDFSGNEAVNGPGGAVHIEGGSLFVQRSRIVGNHSVLQEQDPLLNYVAGGGVSSRSTGSVLIVESELQSNTSHRSGGGLYICADGSGPSELRNVTVSGNLANTSGGGIYVCGESGLRIASSTLADNVANQDLFGGDLSNGGGIYAEDPIGCTICPLGVVRLKNTIVAGNDDRVLGLNDLSLVAEDCHGTLQSDGYAILGSADAASVLAGPCQVAGVMDGVQLDVDPLLDPIADNGGGTWTHAIGLFSPAYNAGNPGGCTDYDGTTLQTDQRGAERVLTCDLGAFESADLPPLIFRNGFESGTTFAWSKAVF